MRLFALAMVSTALAGCKAESSGGAPPAADTGPPVVATFLDLNEDPGSVLPLLPCRDHIVSVVRGSATAGDDHLGVGDVLLTRGYPVSIRGDATVLSLDVRSVKCDLSFTRKVIRASAAPELTFMHGAMHAHLDLDTTVSPAAYFGRLSGTAPVAEHVHAGTWEVLCAVQARGTLTVAGHTERLGPRMCVSVPPDTKHSWQPDEGYPLVALQTYWPPGPEQRFKKLAADETAGDH